MRTKAGFSRGVTLTELMIATAILSIAVLGFVFSFQYITKSLHLSRARTLSANLTQEKIESLKNLSYYQLLLSTSIGNDNNFNPPIVYDTTNYPPESVSIGGITYKRYTLVRMADVTSNIISTTGVTFPDTGMKHIQVNVAWWENGAWKKQTLTNVLENPNVNPLDAGLSGAVQWSSGTAVGPLAGAWVRVEQNADWSAITNSAGVYSFRVYHGTYTIRASSAGYYDATSTQQFANRGSTTIVPTIKLTQIATATIGGYAWYNPGLVIAQVVASTNPYYDTGFTAQNQPYPDLEYITLFNPTTASISITNCTPSALGVATCGSAVAKCCVDAAPNIQLYTNGNWLGGGCNNVSLVYSSTYVPPGYFYTITNSTDFTPIMMGAYITTTTYDNQFWSTSTFRPDAFYKNTTVLTSLCQGGGDVWYGYPEPSLWNPTGAAWSNSYYPSGGLVNCAASCPRTRHLLSYDLYNQRGVSGSVLLLDKNNNTVDSVSWADSGTQWPGGLTWAYPFSPHPPTYPPCGVNSTYSDYFSGACLTFGNGLTAGKQIVRVSTPMANTWPGYDLELFGPAYNSGVSAQDFMFRPSSPFYFSYNGDGINLEHLPYSTTSSLSLSPVAAPLPVVAGMPAFGAYVGASDPFSGSTQAYRVNITSVIPGGTLLLPKAIFNIVGVATTSATSPWTVEIATVGNFGTYWKELGPIPSTADAGAILGQNSYYGIPHSNAAGVSPPVELGYRIPLITVPVIWDMAPNTVKLDSAPPVGFVEGLVTDTSNNPLSVQLTLGGRTGSSGTNGRYFAASSTGNVIILANSNNLPPYIQQYALVNVVAGAITTRNFSLQAGGGVQGYITSGTSPLPNIIVSALLGGNQAGQSSSDTTGVFYIKNLPAGNYTVLPSLDPAVGSSPLSTTVTITTYTVNVGTFTIAGAMANIIGNVTLNGQTLNTGALIIASQGAIPSTPPSISASSSAALGNPIYSVSSQADGSYVLPVRIGNGYNLSAYVPIINATNVSVTTKTYSGINVPAGGIPQQVTLP